MSLTRSKIKVKITGLLNFRQLAKPCMLAAMTAAPLQGFLVFRSSPTDDLVDWNSGVSVRTSTKSFSDFHLIWCVGKPRPHMRTRGLCPFPRRSWAPSNTMWPGPRSTSVRSRILIHPAVWPQQTVRKFGGLLCRFFRGELGPHVTQYGLGRGLTPYQVASWSMQPFAHNTWDKIGGGGAVLPVFGGACAPSNTMWRLNPSSRLATTDMGRKLGVGCCFFGGGRAGSPSNTVAGAEAYLRTKFHVDPSNRLATIKHITDRTDRQRSDSMGITFYRRSVKVFLFLVSLVTASMHWSTR